MVSRIPLNTIVDFGTKSHSLYKTLSTSCSLYAKGDAKIENGNAIHVILYTPNSSPSPSPYSSPSPSPSPSPSTPLQFLTAGQRVDIIDICRRTKATALAIDATSKQVGWHDIGGLPAGEGAWKVETGQAPGTIIDILQPVRLVSNDGMHISAARHGVDLFVSNDRDLAVEFYFTNPMYIPSQNVPTWVPVWFPDFQTHTAWLQTWSQTTAAHHHYHRKWNDVTPRPPSVVSAAATVFDRRDVRPTMSRASISRMSEATGTTNGVRHAYHIVPPSHHHALV